MARHTLHHALGNPLNRSKTPSKQLGMEWPVKSSDRINKSGHIRQILVTLGVTGSLSLFFQSHSPSLHPDTAFVCVIAFLAFAMFVYLRAFSRLLSYVISLLLVMFFIPHTSAVALVGSLLLLRNLVVDFRKHYVWVCSASPVDRQTAKTFRETGQLPAGVPRTPLRGVFSDAVRSWLTYNRAENDSPGLLHSPIGSQRIRHFHTALTVGMVSLGVPAIWLPLTSPSAGPAMEAPHVFMMLTMLLCSVPLVFYACFVGSESTLRDASALKRHATLANYWESFIDDIRNSSNAHEQDSVFFGQVRSDSSPILLQLSSLERHLWLAGGTGSGKTTYLMVLIEQLILRGYSVMCLDLKADTFELLRTLSIASRRASGSIPFWYFTNRPGWSTHFYCVFTQSWWPMLSPGQRTDVLLSAMGLIYSRVYGMSYFSDSTYALLDFVNQKYPDIRSFKELNDRITYEIRHAKSHELSNAVKRDGEHVALIIRRLATVELLNPCSSHSPTAVGAAMDISRCFQQQTVCYWDLNSLIAQTGSAEIGRIVFGSTLAAATTQRVRNNKLVIVIDEFQQLGSASLTQLALRQARSLGISIILANQTAADLKLAGDEFTSTVEGNTSTQLWFKVGDQVGIEQITRLGGKVVDTLVSRTTTSGSNGDSQSRTEHEVIVNRFETNDIVEVSSQPDSTLR